MVRDGHGDFLVAGAGRPSNLKDAFHMEAQVCIAAIENVAILGILESDAATFVSALKEK